MTAPELQDNAALIVIDVQRGYDDAEFWGARNNPACEANVRRLIDAWTASGRPIVLVRHDSVSPDSPLDTGLPGNALKDVVADIRYDLLVSKEVNSAFYGTPDLGAWLTRKKIEQIVLCGIQTNMCVETTARMGGNLGFDVLVAIDACHTFDLEGSDGTALKADQLTAATAVNLSGGEFAQIVTTAQLV